MDLKSPKGMAKFLPAEDSLDLERIIYEKNQKPKKTIKITIPVLGKISNFDDIDSLRMQSFIEINTKNTEEKLPIDIDSYILAEQEIDQLIKAHDNNEKIDEYYSPFV